MNSMTLLEGSFLKKSFQCNMKGCKTNKSAGGNFAPKIYGAKLNTNMSRSTRIITQAKSISVN